MKIILILLIPALCLSGCQTALKKVYGIKKPALEDDASIRRYLTKKHIDTSNIYVFKNLRSFAEASEKKMLTIPDAMFFNKTGNFIPYKKEAEACNANVDVFISDIREFARAPSDPSKKMDELIKLIRGNNIIADSDIYVFITWTIYSGKLNKDKAFEWIKLLETAKSNGVKINYFLLNCDYQKSWNIPEMAFDKLGIKH